MSAKTAEKVMSERQYIEFEKKSDVRHEFMDGEPFSTVGARRKHNLLNTNISRISGNQLEETDCEVYVSDFRVKIRESHNVYPDVAVACLYENLDDTVELKSINCNLSLKSIYLKLKLPPLTLIEKAEKKKNGKRRN